MAEWIVTPAVTADLPELARLINSAYRGQSARLGWTNESDLLRGQRTDPTSLAEELAGPDPSTMLCLREDGQGPILASVFLSKIATEDGRCLCCLGMLTVSPVLQRRGIGKALLVEAEAFARIWGCSAIRITVISQRIELMAWYERRGFAPTGETKPFPRDNPKIGAPQRDGLEFVVMERTLWSPSGRRLGLETMMQGERP